MHEQAVDVMGTYALRWYGWGSPVGLGLFFLLVSTSAAVIRLAFFR